MITLGQIKEEVAQAIGFDSWTKLHKGLLFKFEDFEKVIDIVSKLYANAKLDEAKHMASMQETKEYTTPDIDKGFAQGIDAAIDSILSLKDKIL